MWGIMHHLLRFALISSVSAANLAAFADDQPGEPVAPTYQLAHDPYAPGVHPRQVFVDAAPFTGQTDGEVVVYDIDAALRPVSSSGMHNLPDWAVAVRLVLSEVGADRVVQSRFGLIEAMGVIETVKNRMDTAQWNPRGIQGLQPWPGCGDGHSFADCANSQQYYGMARDRALRPTQAYASRELLLEAVDIAVSAWWLLDSHIVTDVTNGATSFVHPDGVTGPIQFSGPQGWAGGHYEMGVTQRIDYRRDSNPVLPGVFARYLWGDDQIGWSVRGVASDTTALRRTGDAVVAGPGDTGEIVEAP